MQKEMNVDTLPTAVAYEVKSGERERLAGRRRSSTVQSGNTVDTVESEIDPEILINDLEVSDSPVLLLRKKIVA